MSSIDRSPTSPAARLATVPVPADFYRAEGYTVDDSIGYLMARIVSHMGQQVDRQLGEHDLTNAQWKPLFFIAQGRGSTVAELARGCQMDTGAMTRTLDRLEVKGFLRRVRSTTDRRVVNLELTPEGERAAGKVPKVLSVVLNTCLAGFTEEEWQTLKGYLRRMLANAEAMKAAACAEQAQPATEEER